jgi:hypothetical protein
MTDPIEAMARALCKADGCDPDRSVKVLRKGDPHVAWQLYIEDATAARDAHLAAPLPAGDDGELVGWLRKFGPTAKTTTEQNLMDQAADRIAALNAEVARKDELIGKLLGAVSWLEPPFIDDSTAELELRLRIGFCVADKNRALGDRHD